MVYGSATRVDSFGPEAASYIGLAHAVMGSLMIGWGASLLYLGFRAPEHVALLRETTLVSLVAWCVPDTAYSLIAGFWPNAVLNLATLALFCPGLWGLRSVGRTHQ